ncbi:hypothetical protein CHS0354_014947 [Potamilus streckersoni]|uniref:Uncharacterized protein n=1 Tax=Potamilus streckersoni TaxID=2493646 RepID=A0AAE0S819_9BIVA|nr:hypothetical protein CHS0354_014947 [Potamilus streckersoni]
MGIRIVNFFLSISWLLSQRVVQAHYNNQLSNEIRMDKKEAANFLSHESRVERRTPGFCYDITQELLCETSHKECQTEEFREYLCTKAGHACESDLVCTIVGIWCPVHYRTNCTNICDIFGQGVSRCMNGGTCMNISAENYICICPHGFTGKDCELDIDECLNNPCQQSASCHNIAGNYSCNCPSRYTGQNCELDTCKIGPADTVFLVDSSLSEGKDNFNKQLDFIKEFVKSVYIGPTFVRVSVITFSSNARVEFKLTTYLENNTLLDAIDQIQYDPGVTNTGSALRAAREELLQGNRRNVKKRVIILTDGMSSNRNDMKIQAKLLKDAGVHIVVIGIGSEVLHEELLEMASDYSDVFTVSTFDGLNSIQRKIGIYLCEACHPKTSDILYLLDAGNSVSLVEFQGALDALQYLTSLLMGSNDVRVSLVTYAAEPEVKFNFQNNLTEIRIHQKIAILSKTMHPSNHTKVLEYVYQNGFTAGNGARNDTRKVIIHLTNGHGIENDTHHLADMLKNDGKIIIEIGYGDNIDRKAMQSLASYPYMFYHLGEEQFTDVKVLRSLKSLSEYEECNV